MVNAFLVRRYGLSSDRALAEQPRRTFPSTCANLATIYPQNYRASANDRALR
jgi:hypothetical protein